MGVAVAVGWLLGSAPEETARSGGPAPDFAVEMIGGGRFDLSDHLEHDGRPLVLNLWASWCLPCREEIPEIDAFAADHPEIAVLGVSVQDTEAGAVAFAEELAPGYPLAIADAAFDAAYPRIGLPATYVIDADGIVDEIFNGILDRETLEELVFG
ncbi:MAG: TlpA family protein disulfide reductase [Acidimicrobiia bacterium]